MFMSVVAFLLYSTVWTGAWASPLWDPPPPHRDGGSHAVVRRNTTDEEVWSAFYCEGPNFRGKCVTQKFASDRCQLLIPKYQGKMLSFIAASSNCVLYENAACTGGFVPIYSTVQDLRAFNKIKSYQCRVHPVVKFRRPARVGPPRKWQHIHAPKATHWMANVDNASGSSSLPSTTSILVARPSPTLSAIILSESASTSAPPASSSASSILAVVAETPTLIAVPR
ncbi:hypothetical protein HGRIS_012350 [Hohenbuehelia grisea]|uniref:Uncharacterized protein n=1 Tax=Hohenbuehelia grisea TaxID=104357 RepID=A0ABR3IS09_9AGAR